MNGYFRLLINQDGSSICFYPPVEGGKPIDINEVMNYLSAKNYMYDKVAVFEGFQNLSQPRKAFLEAGARSPENEMIVLNVTEDRMECRMRFYPPSNGGKQLSADDILSELKFKQIVTGIDRSAIDAFLNKREYCTDYIAARGKAPVHGSDASISYLFNTDLKIRPTLNEDGSVDFFHLNNINHCHKGDVLARLTPETSGEYGETVFGEKIKPRDVKRATMKYGRNITLSEDRLSIESDVDGHVSIVEGKVFVSDVFSVENVDNATGNIDFDGSIQVNGNVRSGFAVKARGNVEIKGVVEGAVIEAEGDIIIARGMNGMGKGVLKASGNVIAKFLENASVTAGGFVETESIIHCNIMSQTEINVVSKKGFITGGRVCAMNAVHVKNLGSPMGADTIVEVGIDPAKKIRFSQLQKSILELKRELDIILPSLQTNKEKIARGARISPEQMLYFKQLVESAKQKQSQYQEEMQEYEEIHQLMEKDSGAVITVSGEVYSGVKISISDVSMLVNDSLKYCRFIKSQGAVKMTAL